MDKDSCATHGISFPSVIAAKNYAHGLQELGISLGVGPLCKRFRIGTYGPNGWEQVYDSDCPDE